MGPGLEGTRIAPPHWEAMPRFYFDTSNGTYVSDDVGEILADRQAAEAEAMEIAGEIIKNEIGRAPQFDRAIEVRDESGEHFLRIEVAIKFTAKWLR
jgi:hypothetical protein